MSLAHDRNESEFAKSVRDVPRKPLPVIDVGKARMGDAAAIEDDQLCIVGYPFDRYEQEHFANVAELRRMLGHLGVKADSVFFSGEPWSQLVRARHARAFAVLPHAHQEAKVLRRAKVPFEKVGLPMGVGGTTRWLKAVGALMGVPDKRIRAYVKHELARIKPLAELARRQRVRSSQLIRACHCC